MALDQKYKSLLRFLLLVLATAAHSVACTPPTSATIVTNGLLNKSNQQSGRAGEQQDVMQSSSRAGRWSLFWASGSKYFVWSITFIEGATRLLSLYPTSTAAIKILPVLCPNIVPPFHPLSFPPGTSEPFFTIVSSPTLSFSLGFLSVLAGAQIRKACYNALGSLFTFTRTILAEHQLVTRGPYEVVRHPGYVGMVFVRAGIVCMLFSSGSWVRTVGAIPWPFGPAFTFTEMQTSGGVLIGGLRLGLGLFAFLSAGELSVLLRRASKEDAALQSKFGDKWEKYRKNVPYKFVPLIY